MRHKFYLGLTYVLVALFFSACDKEVKHGLYVSPTSLEFDYDEDNMMITINNIGSKEFSWTVNGNLNLMEFSKVSGSCSKNSPDKFQISLKRYNIHEDNISDNISISASNGESVNISVLIHGFPEDKVRINATVYDADYDYIHDKLVLACRQDANSFVLIYDLASGTLSKLPYEFDYTGHISVARDGSYLAVSQVYDNMISYISHLENQVSSSFIVGPSITEVVSGVGGIVYVFQYDYSGSYEMSKLNFITNEKSSYNLTGSLEINDAHLHQSGNFIYGVDDYYLCKIEISNGDPTVVYSQFISYLNERIWISKDGYKIFTDDKAILFIDPEIAGYDVTDQAILDIIPYYIHGVEHDITHNEYYIIPSYNSYFSNGSESRTVSVYNSSFEQIKTIQLEDFYISNSSTPNFSISYPSAEYVFVSSNGNKIIVVSKASDYSNKWGIEVLER